MLCASPPPPPKDSLVVIHILTAPHSSLLKVILLQNLYRVKCHLKDSSINVYCMAVILIKNSNENDNSIIQVCCEGQKQLSQPTKVTDR